ncbi:MAG: glutamate--cysteine ligase [Proteobacteria bacterium]|nr:glutamate--cysteine ligase [Pseudomonadota bacterium]MBU1639357.1 glutamate--cysteine ligase [Pseudomonadota bacterium]
MTHSSTLHIFGGAGVELEYMIVDADSLDVKPLADEVLKAVNGSYYENYEKPGVCWSNELALHVIELKTGMPTPALADFTHLFQQDVGQINTILKDFNARLMPSGAHPWMDPFTETKLWPHHYSAIYESYNKIFDCRGHGWSNLQSAHLNLPFGNDDEFGRLHAAIRVLLPILPALAASTPIVDGRCQDFLDYRMEVYRTNSKKIPSLTGNVIPEPVFTAAEYDTQIFQPMYRDIKPYDPDTILQDEWLNSRGAIARFDRSAIEIRILDVQECPLADLAVASLIINTLKALADGLWSDPGHLKKWRTDALAEILFETVKTAEHNTISNGDYLNIFGLRAKGEMTTRDLWCHILQEMQSHYPLHEVFLEPLSLITQQGTLASRIVRVLNNDVSRPALKSVYGRLCDCLAQGDMFTA